MNETKQKAVQLIGYDGLEKLRAAGLDVVPVVLPPLAVSRVKDLMQEEYGLYSLQARPMWADLLKRVTGLEIERQEQLHASSNAAS